MHSELQQTTRDRHPRTQIRAGSTVKTGRDLNGQVLYRPPARQRPRTLPLKETTHGRELGI
ncbi:MAG: hypothetical protein ACRDRJ_03325 [Streptosporangiaceae bacterium]